MGTMGEKNKKHRDRTRNEREISEKSEGCSVNPAVMSAVSDCPTAEDGPAPSPVRAVYGFVMYLLSLFSACVYLVWCLVPPAWLRAVGLDYWPQQLWALIIPTLLVIAVLVFILLIYPLLGLLEAPGLDDPRILSNPYSGSRPSGPARPDGLPPAYDLDIRDVCRRLYLRGDATAADVMADGDT